MSANRFFSTKPFERKQSGQINEACPTTELAMYQDIRSCSIRRRRCDDKHACTKMRIMHGM